MAQLVLGVAGAAVGSLFGMPQLGFAIGSMIGSQFGPSQKVEGPRLADLKAPQASYGTPIAYVEGSPRLAGGVIWASAKREIVTTTEQGGKGGPSVESTTYSYDIDVLYELSINEAAGVRRTRKNGELIWSIADDADADTLAASAGTTTPTAGDAVIATGKTDHWRELRVYSGFATQMPDSTYEAAVGVGNAPAYRGRCTVMVEGLQLGGGGQLPVLTFEISGGGGLAAGNVVSLWTFQQAVSLTAPEYPPGYPTALQKTTTDDTGNTWTLEGHERDTSYMSGGQLVLKEYQSASTFSNAVLWSAANAKWGAAGDFTVELRLAPGSWINTSSPIMIASCRTAYNAQATGDWWLLWHGGLLGFNVATGVSTSTGASASYAGGPGAIGVMRELCVTRKAGILRMFIDGVLLKTATVADTTPLTTSSKLTIGGQQQGAHYLPNDYGNGTFNGFRFTVGVALYDTNYTPGATWTTSAATILPAPLATPALDDVVSRLCTRSDLTAAQIDVTALASKTVRAMAVSQVTSTRQVLEMLAQAYLYEYVQGEKLRAVLRGGASVASIPFDALGASNGDPVEPLPLRRANDIELPAQVTVKYANMLNDFQDGAESGDRLVTDSTAVSVIELPLGMTPTEAKQLADASTMDIAASMLAIGPIAVTREYAALEPTDVVTLTGEDGSTFRARILKINDAAGVRTMDLTLDDATVINSSAVTSAGYTSTSLVRAVVNTDLELLDIPLLRDADDGPGFYAAFGATGKWPGAALMRSVDGVSYAEMLRATDRAVAGTATTVLADWPGGNVFDELSTVTVNVGAGVLASATRDAIINDRSTNAMLIGSEVVQFRDATLVSAGVYTLTGFLRGRRGTEWAMGTHAAGERVVRLSMTGLRHVTESQSEIGVLRYWKGVTFGKSLADATEETFTDTGIALKPFSPVHVHASRASDGAITLEWTRRTRLASRFVGTAGINVPLGEASVSYSVDVMDGATVKRTLAASTDSVTYSAADQLTDFGATQSSVTARVYQLSATVGRGYPAEATV